MQIFKEVIIDTGFEALVAVASLAILLDYLLRILKTVIQKKIKTKKDDA